MNQNSPSQQSRAELKVLSETFKPLDVKFLLALDSDFSIEECLDDVKTLVSSLKEYVESDHTKVSPLFKSVKVY
jgi:hypothetical protein